MERKTLQRRPTTTGGSYFASPKDPKNFFNTGSKLLSLALGGGWCENRVINIVGDKSTGKTLLCIEACANFALKYPQGKIRYRETEEAFDQLYAAAIGMPIDRIDFGDPDNPLETVEDLVEELEWRSQHAKVPELFLVDSLDGLPTRAELKRAIDAPTYGQEKAKYMSMMFRRIIKALGRAHITLIIVSQVRDNIGAMPFQKKHKRNGGKALDFYCSQIVWLSQLKRLVETKQNIKRVVGVLIKATMDKNKVGLPFREAEFPITFGYGIDDRKSCVEWLKQIRQPFKQSATLEDLHKLVERRWYEIEVSFLPKSKKYGNLSHATQTKTQSQTTTKRSRQQQAARN